VTLQVAFVYCAQDHQLLHSLPIACELSANPRFEVQVLARDEGQAAFARELASYYPEHRLAFGALARPPWLAAIARRGPPPKLLTLFANRRRLARLSAVVVPERTTIALRRLGVTGPKYIHTFHGGSGHDRAGDPRLKAFDLLLAPSARRLERMAAAGTLRPDRAVVIGYTKFDLVRRMDRERVPLFANDRPTVVYNPHHRASTSSWPEMGHAVLDYFAGQSAFNLIFAPHVRLFDAPGKHRQAFDRYAGLPHMLIDLGSRRSIDDTYLSAADIYLGDISSQVFEFLVRPRPCLFLNPRGLAWEDDPDFASWRLGPVVASVDEMSEALATIPQWREAYRARQEATIAEQFPRLDPPAPVRGAEAIAAFLLTSRPPAAGAL